MRRYMVIAAAVTLAVMALPAATTAAEVARGVVFEDTNGNGKRDTGEKGLAGVPVSNQSDVVVTDADGRYELPVTTDTILFVTNPPGYASPVGKHQLPVFYYIHKPDGSPRLRYEGVAPTGPLPDSVDFPLVPADAPDRFRIVALADTQPESGQELGYLREDIVPELMGTDAAALVNLGDIMFDRLDLFDALNDALGRIGIPVRPVIGNHDLNFDAPDDRDSDETFHRHYGPNYYSWNMGRVHFIVLDTVRWNGPDAERETGNYSGALDETQLRWVQNDLKHVPADALVVLLMHIPLYNDSGKPIEGAGRLLDLLKNRPRVLALAGHWHRNDHRYYTKADGWEGDGSFHHVVCATASGSWWGGPKDYRGVPLADQSDGTPNGYTFVDFDGTNYRVTFKGAGLDPRVQMRIFTPDLLPRDPETSPGLVVNFFYGNDRCTVEYSLNGGEFRAMQRERRRDPLAEALYSGPMDAGKSWVNPAISTHIWTATFGEPLPRGLNSVTVRATDEYGRVWTAGRVFNR
ncbi:MAG: calcineurin-like phosphoesterase family protein [Candidatus Sumerlaeaceae bacterium]|nr:calcineurin-like phosphoesterase family protein [Candidatus Sumerlaeaceae bacterium]